MMNVSRRDLVIGAAATVAAAALGGCESLQDRRERLAKEADISFEAFLRVNWEGVERGALDNGSVRQVVFYSNHPQARSARIQSGLEFAASIVHVEEIQDGLLPEFKRVRLVVNAPKIDFEDAQRVTATYTLTDVRDHQRPIVVSREYIDAIQQDRLNVAEYLRDSFAENFVGIDWGQTT
jgi:hypothetical protein